MQRLTTIAALVVVLGALMAEEWIALDDEGIKSALSGRSVEYTRSSQSFLASGETTDVDGRPSLGYWRVDGGKYCSQWPPRQTWNFYSLDVSEDRPKYGSLIRKADRLSGHTQIDQKSSSAAPVI